MNAEVEIAKLSVAQVKEIQTAAQKIDAKTGKGGMELMMKVIQSSIEGARDMNESDFDNIPFDELQALSNSIMDYSGMRVEAGNANSQAKK